MTDSEQRPRKPRSSITKLQRQTAIGAELIELCQTVTEDGHLLDEEVTALRQWLDDNRGADLPAVAFLRQTVERILADGKVTVDERRDLYVAIETILPPDIREVVRATRRSEERAWQDEKRLENEARDAERETTRKAQGLNAPLGTWDFIVAGVRYENRLQVVQRFATPRDQVFLIRERDNPKSRNAIEVRLSNGMQAGYVPEVCAVQLAPFLDQGCTHNAFIKKMWASVGHLTPVVEARLYAKDANVPGAVAEASVPPKPAMARKAGCGCVVAIGLLGGLASLAAWVIALGT
jgi:HIRAN domain-containing protein